MRLPGPPGSNTIVFAPTNTLVLYVVFERPRDYPDAWVVRRQFVMPGRPEPVFEPKPWVIGCSLFDVNQTIPEGLTWIPRSEDDDPVIVGSWI